ncbi:MAG: hypothetical protein ACR2GN_05930, partial [Bacteroidia bacterium]
MMRTLYAEQPSRERIAPFLCKKPPRTLKTSMTATMLSMLFLLTSIGASAQVPLINGAAVKANFGVDADVYANVLQFGPFVWNTPNPPPAVGTDDWFVNQSLWPGSGIGVIGTTAATAKPPLQISAADYKANYCQSSSLAMRNHRYIQGMAYPFGTVINGQLLIDAVGARDNISTGNQQDSSVFTSGSNKNGDNPNTWNVGIGGTPQKNDIVDVGGHLRRDLTTGDLWGFGYATTLSADGSSHRDFEIFRTLPVFDPISGTFTNSGPN